MTVSYQVRFALRPWLLGSLFAVAGLRPALAQEVDDKTRNAARNLAEQGQDTYDKGDYARALDLFHRAYALVPVPTIAIYEARSLAKLGRLVQAQEAYLRATRSKLTAASPPAFRGAVREAEAEELALEPRIPKVTIVLSGLEAQAQSVAVRADGELLKPELIGVEMPIDPGSHVLSATGPGLQEAKTTFEIQEGASKRVELHVERESAHAEPPPPPKPVPVAHSESRAPLRSNEAWQRPTAYAAGALGVAGLATGIIVGSMAQSRYSEAKTSCPNRACVTGSSGDDALHAFRTLRTVSTVGYVVSGVGLAAGATLLILAPRRASSASAALWLGPTGAEVRGAF